MLNAVSIQYIFHLQAEKAERAEKDGDECIVYMCNFHHHQAITNRRHKAQSSNSLSLWFFILYFSVCRSTSLQHSRSSGVDCFCSLLAEYFSFSSANSFHAFFLRYFFFSKKKVEENRSSRAWQPCVILYWVWRFFGLFFTCIYFRLSAGVRFGCLYMWMCLCYVCVSLFNGGIEYIFIFVFRHFIDLIFGFFCIVVVFRFKFILTVTSTKWLPIANKKRINGNSIAREIEIWNRVSRQIVEITLS